MTGKQVRVRIYPNGLVKCQRPCTVQPNQWTTYSSHVAVGDDSEIKEWAENYIRTVEDDPNVEIKET